MKCPEHSYSCITKCDQIHSLQLKGSPNGDLLSNTGQELLWETNSQAYFQNVTKMFNKPVSVSWTKAVHLVWKHLQEPLLQIRSHFVPIIETPEVSLLEKTAASLHLWVWPNV
jgi:hypothetical protein